MNLVELNRGDCLHLDLSVDIHLSYFDYLKFDKDVLSEAVNLFIKQFIVEIGDTDL